MSRTTITSNDLIGLRVVGGKSGEKHIGKVRHLVFHPKERRVIGFIVKRPDLALMFHRKDLFVALDSYEIVDGRVCVSAESGATDKAACKRLGVDWDSCVLWSGMSIVTESGTTVGTIGTVTFDGLTGRVESVVADRGATSKALLGTVEIPVVQIRGFRFGIGELVSEMESQGEVVEEESELRGAILAMPWARRSPSCARRRRRPARPRTRAWRRSASASARQRGRLPASKKSTRRRSGTTRRRRFPGPTAGGK